jgi:hypothetical protein
MKVTRFLVSLLLLSVAASSAFAEGAVSLSWDTCVGPINKAIAPGTTPFAFASVLGMTTQSSGYEVDMLLGSGAAGPLRDAWRFDPSGCEGSALIAMDQNPTAAVSKVCPALQGPAASLQIKDYSYDNTTGKARLVFANAYPSGANTTVATTRYHLVNVKFDMTFGVVGPSDPGNTCGGLEVPVCVHLTKQIYIQFSSVPNDPANGTEHSWLIQQEFITSNDAGNTVGCPGATATKPATWGQIKNTYHN